MKTNQLQKNIPNGWQTHKLGNVVDIVNGKTPLRSRSDFWIDGIIPWFTIDDIRSNGRFINKTNQTITNIALKESGIKIIPENSTLICCTASVGEYALTKIPLATNQQFNALIPKDKKVINPLFLYYVTQTFDSRLKQIMGSTTFGFVSVGTLSNFDIEIPSNILEQEKIAEILSKVDENIEKTEKVIEENEKLKRGLMQELLTKGINKTKLKKIKLGDVSDVIMGQSPSSRSYNQNGTGLPFIQGKSDFSKDMKNIVIRQWTSEPTKISEIGDILFTVRAPVGELSINTEKICIGRGISAIRVNKDYSRDYIYYSLINIEEVINKKAQGSTFTAINREDVKKIEFLIPLQKTEQVKIAEILSSIDEKILVNNKLKEKLIQLKKGLMLDLLNGKIRIK